MGRTGVTFTEVDEAARYLQGRGVNPTVDAIRSRLGTGSRTTLSEHLKRWKALQADGEGKLPESLLALIKGLWDSLQAQAETRIQENQSIAHQEILTLKTQLQTALEMELRLKRECHQLQEELDTTQRAKSGIEAQLQALEQSHDKLNTLCQMNAKQRDEAKQENERLHTLAMQIQANLEHYQQAIQEQQVKQNLAQEAQQVAVTQEMIQLRALLEETKRQYEQCERSRDHYQLQGEQLKTEHAQLRSRYEKLHAKNQEAEHRLAHLQANEELSQKQFQKIEQELVNERDDTQSLRQQIAVLADQLQQAKATLHQTEDKIETLRHEKILLIQEKAQVEGALNSWKLQREATIKD